MPNRLQLLVVFWSTGAAGIFLTQALTAGDPSALAPALALGLAACLGATTSRWLPACQRRTAAMGARFGTAPEARRGAPDNGWALLPGQPARRGDRPSEAA
jgi:hypothetical protein